MRHALEFRAPINLGLATVIGVVGLHRWPFPTDNAFLAVIAARKPLLFEGLAHLYATLWFSTPLIALSVVSALLYVAVMRGNKRPACGPLPAYPEAASDGLAISGVDGCVYRAVARITASATSSSVGGTGVASPSRFVDRSPRAGASEPTVGRCGSARRLSTTLLANKLSYSRRLLS